MRSLSTYLRVILLTDIFVSVAGKRGSSFTIRRDFDRRNGLSSSRKSMIKLAHVYEDKIKRESTSHTRAHPLGSSCVLLLVFFCFVFALRKFVGSIAEKTRRAKRRTARAFVRLFLFLFPRCLFVLQKIAKAEVASGKIQLSARAINDSLYHGEMRLRRVSTCV